MSDFLNLEYSLLGVSISGKNFGEILDTIDKAIMNDEKLHIVTVNPEMVMSAGRNKDFLDIINSSTLNTPDGTGIRLGILFKYGINIEKVTGIDLVNKLLDISSEKKYKIFLFGSRQEVLEDCYTRLISRNNPPLIVGYHNGYLKSEQEKSNVVEQINKSRADIVFVGMGSPLQELWIKENMLKVNAKVFMGVGGVFDVLSGKLKRAPLIFQRYGVEWIYRFVQQPKRFCRFLVLPRFVFESIAEAIRFRLTR